MIAGEAGRLRNLFPTRPIAQSDAVDIAGRRFDLHVAPFAATEADLWIYDAATKTVIAGDLVVAEVPFIDQYTTYYVTESLRSPSAHERFCHPLRAK